MKKAILLFMSSIIMGSISARAGLDYGECRAVPNSKNYLTNNFSEPYPKTVSFTCGYECRGDQGVEIVEGTSHIRTANVKDDGIKVVCQGIQVRYTGVYFEFQGAKKFYAYDAKAPEVKDWAFRSVDKNNPLETKKLKGLKKTLNQVGASYLQAGSSPEFAYFKQAGKELVEIAQGLPEKTDRLDQAVELYVSSGGDWPNTSKEGLIQGILESSASFRIP